MRLAECRRPGGPRVVRLLGIRSCDRYFRQLDDPGPSAKARRKQHDPEPGTDSIQLQNGLSSPHNDSDMLPPIVGSLSEPSNP